MANGILYKSKRVLLSDGLQEAAILVGRDGKISRILRAREFNEIPTGISVVDANDLVIMPGIVDSHVHVNEPGRTEWEGFATATKAAAAGGVTTIVDMPLNSIPPTTTVANFQTKLAEANKRIYVDVAFWGGVIPGNQKELSSLVTEGVVGFKCFLCPSGVEEFPHVTAEDVEVALQHLQGSKTVLAFHAECEVNNVPPPADSDSLKYETFLNSRPPEMETEAIQLVISLCNKYKVRCHIVHLSSADALPLVRDAKSRGTPVTAETCHHYLTLAAEDVPYGATQYKCCPPVRNLQNKEKLWAGLKSGDLDMVVSDHSPCVPELKHITETCRQGDFLTAWGGISSLQFGLSIFWTQAKDRGFTVSDVSRLLSEAPAKLCGLKGKGKLEEGMDADMVIWDPDASFKVHESIIQHRHKVTPYLGMTLKGVVVMTVIRGHKVYEKGKVFVPPRGELIHGRNNGFHNGS